MPSINEIFESLNSLNIDKRYGIAGSFARDVIKRYNVNFNNSSQNALYKNKDAFDLCSFYLAQFGEKVKLLTDSSKSNLSTVVDLNILKYFSNIIDHDYESVNKLILQGYIQS